jgi:hypothetical protein
VTQKREIDLSRSTDENGPADMKKRKTTTATTAERKDNAEFRSHISRDPITGQRYFHSDKRDAATARSFKEIVPGIFSQQDPKTGKLLIFLRVDLLKKLACENLQDFEWVQWPRSAKKAKKAS